MTVFCLELCVIRLCVGSFRAFRWLATARAIRVLVALFWVRCHSVTGLR